MKIYSLEDTIWVECVIILIIRIFLLFLGIANVTGINLGEIVLYNIFYEVFTVCTSIVAQDNQDKLYHARNLDFGLFLGWDVKTHDWAVTEKLREIIININWTRGGQTVYKSVNFAGYIGIYNGVNLHNLFSNFVLLCLVHKFSSETLLWLEDV